MILLITRLKLNLQIYRNILNLNFVNFIQEEVHELIDKISDYKNTINLPLVVPEKNNPYDVILYVLSYFKTKEKDFVQINNDINKILIMAFRNNRLGPVKKGFESGFSPLRYYMGKIAVRFPQSDGICVLSKFGSFYEIDSNKSSFDVKFKSHIYEQIDKIGGEVFSDMNKKYNVLGDLNLSD